MAFPTAASDRLDDARFRGLQSPRDESPTYTNFSSPFRPMMPSTNSHERASLQRRFTTNAVPTLPTMGTMTPLSPIGLQRRQAAEQTEYNAAPYHTVQLIERKKKEIEALREKRRRFQLEMESFDLQTKQQEDALQNQIQEMGVYSGHQSEPTTPPDYRDAGFPSFKTRSNRYSISHASPPNGQATFRSRANRPGSQRLSYSSTSTHVPSKSVPESLRNSDEDEEYDFDIPPVPTRAGATLNRISAPVTNYDHSRIGASDVQDLHNTAAFVLDDEEKTSLSMEHTADQFPMLVRRSTGTQQLDTSGLSGLTSPISPDSDKQAGGWPLPTTFARHRSQQSVPLTSFNNRSSTHSDAFDSVRGALETPTKNGTKARHSLEVNFGSQAFESKRSSLITSPNGSIPPVPRLTSSFSTNDIPTLKGTNGVVSFPSTSTNTPKTHAQQHLHNHNASIGRIPPTASGRQSRDLSADFRSEEASKFVLPMQPSALQANAAPFGPSSSAGPNVGASITTTTNSHLPSFSIGSPQSMANNNNPYYGGYGMPMLNGAFNNFNIGTPQPQWNNQVAPQMYHPPATDAYRNALHSYGNGRLSDSQARVIAQRRQQQNEENARYANLSLDQMRGQIYQYCKDQHGCRFLQKKLEEKNPEALQAIFDETKEHVVELMQDPFGNYLCQKLLEFSNDEQRTVLINNAAPEMVKVALNQHGTRALQKMIEHVGLTSQIETIIFALKDQVVPLIQDLNGNHVIQKCLNHLEPKYLQFIFDAVGANCVVVGTHRHGCCVLQRCMDHANAQQKTELVRHITQNAFALIQDPFGNYVVQYILDINEQAYSQPLCLSFSGHISTLSRQKFSSNVIEKCIRVADPDTKRLMVQEMCNPTELQKMASDSFANYVIQTAIEYADPETKTRLLEELRLIVPSIRNTPHGRRFMSKIQDHDSANGAATSAGATQTTGDRNGLPPGPPPPYGTPHRQRTDTQTSFHSPQNSLNNLNGFGLPAGNVMSPQPHRLSNPPADSRFQQSVAAHQQQHQSHHQQAFAAYGRGNSAGNGNLGFF